MKKKKGAKPSSGGAEKRQLLTTDMGEVLASAAKEIKRNRQAMTAFEKQSLDTAKAVNANASKIQSALKDSEHSRLVDAIVARREMLGKFNTLEDSVLAELRAFKDAMKIELGAVRDSMLAEFGSFQASIRTELASIMAATAQKIDAMYAKIGEIHAESFKAQNKRLADAVSSIHTDLSASTAKIDSVATSMNSEMKESEKRVRAEVGNSAKELRTELGDASKKLCTELIPAILDRIDASHSAIAKDLGDTETSMLTCLKDVKETVSKAVCDEAGKVRTEMGASQKEIDTRFGDAENALQSELNKAEKIISAGIGDAAKTLHAKLDESEGKTSASLSSTEGNVKRVLHDKVNSVLKTINDGRGLYYNPDEVVAAEARGLCDIARRPGFEAEYKALVRNLPPESIATINRIISRLERIKGQEGRLDIYSDDEKVRHRDLLAFWHEVVTVSDGVYCWRNYMLPKKHFSPNVFFFRYGMDLMKNPDAFRDKDVIDIGAYIGDSALLFSEYTSGRIFCFEASSKNYALMQKTMKMNGLGRVVAENLALGAQDGELELMECADRSDRDSFMASMLPDPDSVEKCRVITLDEYVAENKLANIGLIKMDVEGFEQEVIKGALNTIRNYRPALLISIYHNADDFMKIKPMIEALDLGYDMRIYHPYIRSVVDETLLVCEQKPSVAKPAGRTRKTGFKKPTAASADKTQPKAQKGKEEYK